MHVQINYKKTLCCATVENKIEKYEDVDVNSIIEYVKKKYCIPEDAKTNFKLAIDMEWDNKYNHKICIERID